MKNEIHKAQKIVEFLVNHRNWSKVEKIIDNADLDGFNKSQKISKILDYPLLGFGTFRMAIDVSGFAVKIPIRRGGELDSLDEKKVWEKLPQEARTYFVPFLASDSTGYVSVFQKARKFEQYSDIFRRETNKKLKQWNLEVEDLESAEQWGIINGNLIILDYSETIFDY
jgi:hypothetical protein